MNTMQSCYFTKRNMQEALKKENTKLLEIELEKKKEERPTGTVFGNNNAEVTNIRDLEK